MSTQNPISPATARTPKTPFPPATMTAAIGFCAKNLSISSTPPRSPTRAPGRVGGRNDRLSSLRRTRSRHAMCWDDHMPIPRLRSRPVWQQVALIALVTWLVGILVYMTGIHRLLAGYDHAPLWMRLLELTALCGLVPLRRRVPAA